MTRVLGGVIMGVVLSALVGLNGPGEQVVAQDKKEKEAPAVLTIELKKDTNSKFRFNIHSGTKSVMICTKGYESKDEALKVINHIKQGVGKAKINDLTKDSDTKDKDKE